ncbi:MFS transporter [Streptomyces boncukensis]|uniref:MFS transporter n=1 Tax=Streptomyces boncukensis TaxID=2711219 RepID=A0A6G4WYT8_9ACTN|nr:MFS transporter [Streptomyces boncukensis]NGO69684.1 MFS transporter [Streptomyces boncukensis]
MSADGATAVPAPPGANRRPGLALFVIAAAQLIVVVDATITNIALPSIQGDLGMSDANLAWVVNAYALAFGGLLLLGGRAGDLLGRRRVFQAGIAVFTLASLLGGLAPNEGLLLAARVLQGVGAALAAPSALALIATTFPPGRARNRAMGVYAGMGGVGGTIGMLLGGTLTDVLDWRWVFFINIPIGAAILAGTRVLGEAERHTGRLDVPGALTGTGGLVALVHGITRGGEHGWSDGLTLLSFGAAAALLTAFLILQSRAAHPMMPLHLLRDRNRSGSYAAMLFLGGGMFAMFYFLTLYMQLVLGYSPVRAGFASLPFCVGMPLAAGVSSRLSARVPPRALAGPGLGLAAVGMLWFSTLAPDSSYAAHVLPASFVTAIGLGLCFVPLTLGAVSGVGYEDSGIASALLNTAQQIGGALGLAVLSTVSTSAADGRMPGPGALTHGYTRAFLAAAVVFAAGLAVAVTAVNAKRQEHDGDPADVDAPPAPVRVD